jgi:hypothetical protein
LFVGAVGVAFVACDSVTDGGGCDEQPISRYLKRIMYWGTVAAGQDEPNQGTETGDIYQPIWHRPDRILVRTARVDAGAVVRGIFEVSVDSLTQSFQGVSTFAFPFLIRDFDYDPATAEFAVTFSRDPVNIQTVRALAIEPSLVVVDTVLNESWYPRAARYAEGGGLFVYARSPVTQAAGFYFLANPPLSVDSLLYAVDLSIPDARGFDVAAGELCFGVTNGLETQVSVIDLAGDRQPRKLATIDGSFVSVCVNPSGTCAVVSTEVFAPDPGSIVGILDLATGSFSRVDVRTRLCGFVIADFASWDPAGKMFAFSASGFTGESQVYPRQLWARRNVSCR